MLMEGEGYKQATMGAWSGFADGERLADAGSRREASKLERTIG
jgi:hypothetical protein